MTAPLVVDDLEAAWENEKCCDYRRVDGDVVLLTCGDPAEWLHVHRCCGAQSFLCGPHHDYFLNRGEDLAIRCRYCRFVTTDPSAIYSATYRV